MSTTSPEPRFAWWAPFVAILAAVSATVVVITFMQGVGGLEGEGGDELSPGGLLGGAFVQHAFFVLAAVLFAKVTIDRVTPSTFGLRRIRLSRKLWLAPLLFLVFYVFLQAFGQLVDPNAEDDLPTDLGARDSTAALVGVVILVGIVAPLAEELFFRGFLFPALARPLGWIFAALIAGAIFGLFHAGGTDAVFIAPLVVFGIVLCVLYKRVGSLLPGMGLHAFNNGLALGSVLDWSVLGTIASALLAPVVVISLATLIATE